MPYASFYADFPEIATNETRQITIENSTDLRNGKYYLVELFCNEKKCDCKRVIFNVAFGEKQTAVAVISYGWESREFYENWYSGNDPRAINEMHGVNLNFGSPQSKDAPELLKIISSMVKNDINYVERIKNHYDLFRAKVDSTNKIEQIKSLSPVDRNAPCPCGSGKKYKRCCIGERSYNK